MRMRVHKDGNENWMEDGDIKKEDKDKDKD